MTDMDVVYTPGVEPPAGLANLSDWEFWTGDRAARFEGFAQLRDTPGLPYYPEAAFEGSMIPPGKGLLRGHAS